MSSAVARSTALRAGGACVRCRKGKTKCVYENGRAPCKNCAKGMHECYLPSESMAHHHGQSPARHTNSHRNQREPLPASGAGGASEGRQSGSTGTGSSNRNQAGAASADKLTPELLAECERVVSKTFPACVAFHKPSFVQQIKSTSLEASLVYGLLACAARSSTSLIRRHGNPTQAAETFAAKAMTLINQNVDHPNLADIQSLCLVVLHEWGTRNAVRAYIFLGQAARMLQMYRVLNSHRNDPDQFLRDESFRRTLWLIYILDCLLTSTPGRSPALSLQDTADISLPCSDINFAFGNAVYVKTLAQHLDPARIPSPHVAVGEVGEFGYIVLAATIWREVVGMLTVTSLQNFREETCQELISKIDGLRASLPMQFVDKPGQINLHMTMGSGYTFAMLHCLLHCSSIFVHRRRLLQEVTAPGVTVDGLRASHKIQEMVDRLFTSSHAIVSLLTAVEAGSEKDHLTCFPIVMLFSAFTASATIAYLSLKGLTPHSAVETAGHIVEDGVRFMTEGTENWPLMASWLRHLTVMQRVLSNDAAMANNPSRHSSQIGGVKDEISSNTDTNVDAMDFDHHSSSEHARATGSVPPAQHGPSPSHSQQPPASQSGSGSARGESEPPVAIPRRPGGITTINGNSSAMATSPTPSAQQYAAYGADATKHIPSPESGSGTAPEAPPTSQDMTAPELCSVFERQLLEMDDLAAFMGGGV